MSSAGCHIVQESEVRLLKEYRNGKSEYSEKIRQFNIGDVVTELDAVLSDQELYHLEL